LVHYANLHYLKYEIKEFKKDEYIFREDQPSDYIGIIISGCIELKKILFSGNIISIFNRNTGDIFGGSVAFSNYSNYPFDVIAREKTEIFFLNKNSMFEVLFKNPIIASNLMTIFSNRVMQFERKIELFSYSSIKKKIAFSLLYDMEYKKKNLVYLPYSKKTWSENINVSRPSLCRELKSLSEKNIISIKDRAITIIDRDQLESILIG